jgi:DNA gyrase subunit A
MYELGLSHNKPHRKCARIVGDTMGKYHPHGDSSIYDALVVMAQDFKKNEPLAEPHGNFGSIEGDGSAAMRYTEARLKQLTEEAFLADLDKDVVDFVPNFDETEKEPEVLPVRIPNLLINGAEGIAVGMTTNIPSHNLAETINCMIKVLDNPEVTLEELMQILPGPDFTTGGLIVNQNDLPAIYASGTGKIKLRGKTEVETIPGRSGKKRLVITEIPYTMIGEGIHKFLSDVAQLAESRVLPEITDISNESSKEGIRIVLELKKDADVENIKNILYKKTKLEDTFGVNMIAIENGYPVTLNLKHILESNIQFQIEINTRKYTYLLKKEEELLEIQEGLIQAIDMLDLIIEVIRGSKSQAQAKACLTGQEGHGVVIRTKELQKQAEKLHFTQRQAQAILELRLSRLIGLEILALEKEHKKTVKNIKTYKKILSDGNTMKETIKNDLIAIRDRYGVERKTSILQAQEVVIKKVDRKPQKLVFLMDRFGYAKTVDEKLYQKYGEEQLKEYKYSCPCMSNGKIQIFTEGARLHQVKVSEIPQTKLKDKGVPIDNLSTYDSTMEQILYVRSIAPSDEQLPFLIFVTKNGLIKKTESSEFITNNRNVVATKLLEDDELVYVGEEKDSQLVLVSEKGYFLRFTADEIPTMKKNSQGSKGMELVASDKISKVYAVTPQENVQLALSEEKNIALDRIRLKKRGEKGIKLRK